MQPIPSTASIRTKVDRAVALRDSVESRLSAVKTQISDMEEQEETLALVSELFRRLIDQEVTTGVRAVEKLLTEGLQTVFSDQDLSVRTNVKIARGKVSVDILTTDKRSDGICVEGSSLEGFGGSVSTVQSVILRIIVMIRRGLRPFLVLDEALPAFDSHYIVGVGRFLKVLCDRLDIDILMVTHNQALVESVDTAYRAVRTKNGTVFERLR